ncbi:DivIVA domain-containing protein [Streptomyces microflavus]|uniref:DivIVA domain-containing protein n=1 Tax=Streptomyces microflavus TaxID=1919 RepID=UPI0036C72063
MLTPADIEQKQFAATRLREGYDQDEVDGFLDQVAVDYRQIEIELEKAVRDAARARRELEAARLPVPQDTDQPSLESIKTILVAAQRTADQCVADGQEQAGRAMADASLKAQALIDEAKAEARQIVGAAHEEQRRQINALEQRRTELVVVVNELASQRDDWKKWLEGALDHIKTKAGPENA